MSYLPWIIKIRPLYEDTVLILSKGSLIRNGGTKKLDAKERTLVKVDIRISAFDGRFSASEQTAPPPRELPKRMMLDVSTVFFAARIS